ncbi:murein transglycosylase domain-containing protein [Helicobacter mesocricetorum]|uniref:murein transglycosylase domain-containing protein n=1 Tax=Helicobacter mesocricetorum TaxID=87012 RepID=UPI001F22EE14|nr:murein transglycosylase domain-containing protein [Helicobacter mesocricetorum]
MKILTFCFGASILLAGCLMGYRDLVYNPQAISKEAMIKQAAEQAVEYVFDPKKLEEDIKNIPINFKKALTQLTQQVSKKWGKDNTPTASQDVYVKYTDSYLSRAEVDFSKGVISVSTMDTKNPKEALKKAIVTTLLTPEDPQEVDLYSDKDIEYKGKPYLANLVKDNEGIVVLYPWRANRYAKYLVENKLQTKDIVEDGTTKKMHYVQFDMVGDREIQSEHKYGEYVALYSKEYKLEQALIFAIIKTESSFNPYAVSRIPAYGLMQVVPGSAGRDVYKSLNNRDGIPTKEMLFTPKINIQYGSAYLNILFTRYLKGIKNSLSQEYAVIAAYNTGSGNVLSVFHSDRTKAVEVINRMTSAEVYRKLRTSLKYEEARNYLLKVTTAKKEFQSASGNTASLENIASLQ